MRPDPTRTPRRQPRTRTDRHRAKPAPNRPATTPKADLDASAPSQHPPQPQPNSHTNYRRNGQQNGGPTPTPPGTSPRHHPLCQESWNLSLGYTKPRIVSGGDPLATAAEKAWKSGIVVVAAVGNDGSAKDTIAIPARNPYVIAVGASDTRGTSDPSDDSVAPFSSRAHGRSADLVAPGVGVVSVRVAGSVIDAQFPAARQGTALFRGNGTSQATAVVSGGAALRLRPGTRRTQHRELHGLVGARDAS